MADLTWGGQLAVDHDDAFVHLEVPSEDRVSVITCTPSTEHVRGVYAAQHGDILAEEHGREFDRWLAQHDAEVLHGASFALDVHDRYIDATRGRSSDGFATRTATTLREVRKAVT